MKAYIRHREKDECHHHGCVLLYFLQKTPSFSLNTESKEMKRKRPVGVGCFVLWCSLKISKLAHLN